MYTASALCITNDMLQVDPIKGNVAFGACQSGWSFTLLSFAQLYSAVYGINGAMDPREFARRLWGDVYFHPDTRKFSKKPPIQAPAQGSIERTFVQYILTPLYKIYSQVCAAALLIACIRQGPDEGGLGIGVWLWVCCWGLA